MQIRRIQLMATDLPALASFYGEQLGLPVAVMDAGAVRVIIGWTEMVFEARPSSQEKTSHHFAITVPRNRFSEAKDWLKSKTPLIESEGQDAFHFSLWNADAVYFRDPAGNIGELIARRTLDFDSDEEFGAGSMQCVSEVGMVAHDVARTAQRICQAFGLQRYPGGKIEAETDFVALGDERGLFIVVEEGRAWAPDWKTAACSAPMSVIVETPIAGALDLEPGPCCIRGLTDADC